MSRPKFSTLTRPPSTLTCSRENLVRWRTRKRGTTAEHVEACGAAGGSSHYLRRR
ncbi:hypothetical protein JG688_00015148 [Phytophthora aleatoria]|uniref:Uncharacterized protein n=1 Tax=Phytophthora aleatoria TaxID=2496075 RepID=A0A8J5IER5_9STRA|nr:hypothetical protein JG688_00015148 [Phytophthora aleatoria]